MNSSAIDLSRLAAPELVEVIDFETLYAERKARLISLYPIEKQAEVAATLELESEPQALLLQESCYREINLRQRVNDAARSVLLAYARGSTLDHVAALLGVQRLIITPATFETSAVMESDANLRIRVQLAPESFSVAGPVGAYKSSAMNADGRVLDAGATSPVPGTVLVTVLSRDGDGTADTDLLNIVSDAVGAEDVRPLTDQVVVQSAEILDYEVEARIYTFPGPDSSLVMTEARKNLDAYLLECHKIGREVALSGIYAALHVGGVDRVALIQPTADLVANETQAPHCTSILITGGAHG